MWFNLLFWSHCLSSLATLATTHILPSPEECPAGVAGGGTIVQARGGGGEAHRAHQVQLLLHPLVHARGAGG